MIPERPTTGRPKKFSNRSGRDHKICIRISSSDIRKLEMLCEYYGCTKTYFIISLISNSYDGMRRHEKSEA